VGGRATAGRRGIDEGQYTPIAKLLMALAGIFAHVTQEQVVDALLPSPDDGVAEFLARVTVEELWGKGEMALWGRLSVAGGKPVLRPGQPHHRLGPLERILGGSSLILEDGTHSVLGDGGNVLGLMPHPENHVEAALGCTDGRGLFAGLAQHFGKAA
jgi:hypothetical protein